MRIDPYFSSPIPLPPQVQVLSCSPSSSFFPSFLYPIEFFHQSIYSFPVVRYSCPLSTGVLQDLLCLKVYSWYILAGRCTPCLATPLPSCSQLSKLVFTVMLSFSVTAYKLIHSSPYFSTLSWTYTVDSESEIIKIINIAANFLCSGLVTKLCLTLATPWIVACKAPLSRGFSRQEYWSGLLCPSPGDLPDPGPRDRAGISYVTCIGG